MCMTILSKCSVFIRTYFYLNFNSKCCMSVVININVSIIKHTGTDTVIVNTKYAGIPYSRHLQMIIGFIRLLLMHFS